MQRPDTVSDTYRPGFLSAALLGLSRHTPLGRGQMRKQLARAIRHLNKDRPLDVGLYGGQARLHHTGNNSEIKALLAPHRYAREEYAFCRQHMPSEQGVFVDIGANAGIFSLFIASLMQSGTLLAIEPQREMFNRLNTNFALNPGLAGRLNLHFENIAVGGSEPGRLELSLPDSAGQASARYSGDAPRLDVAQYPLHQLLHQKGMTQIDLLKIDVEGFEDAVLYPFFAQADSRLHPEAIVMEACHAGRWEQDCEALLVSAGYDIVHRDRTNMMLVKR